MGKALNFSVLLRHPMIHLEEAGDTIGFGETFDEVCESCI